MYIGSTFRDLNIRLQEHQRANKYFKADGYGDIMSSLIIIHTNNYDIHLLQHFNWISKKQLHDKEKQYINKLECVNIKGNKHTELMRKNRVKYNNLLQQLMLQKSNNQLIIN